VERTQLIGWWNGYVLLKLASWFILISQTCASGSHFTLALSSRASRWHFPLILSIGPLPHVPYPTAEYCRAYEEPLARHPNWIIPGLAPRRHSCDSNNKAAPELSKMVYFVLHPSTRILPHIGVSCTTLLLTNIIGLLLFVRLTARLSPHLLQFLQWFTAPYNVLETVSKLHREVIITVLHAPHTPILRVL